MTKIRNWLAIAALTVPVLAGSAVVAGSAYAYTNPHPDNHCLLWANHVLHPVYPHCYANLHP